MKIFTLILLLCCLPVQVLAGNTGIPNAETDQVISLTGVRGNVNVTVKAKTEAWQASGIRVQQGEQVQLKASGQWQLGGFCHATGPDGQGGETLLCNDAFNKRIVTAFNGSALLGKIGPNGKPFKVNDLYEFTAATDGMLYFAANDVPGFYFDNSGSINVSIRLLKAAPGEEPEQVAAPSRQPVPVSTPQAAPLTTAKSKRWAVVIGISQYRDSRIPSLRYAAADAHSFYEWLFNKKGGRYAPSQVKLLADKDATNANIREALFNWLRQAITEDVVTIYFAGHGSPDSPDSPGNLFLLPYDTNYDHITTTGFPMWDIETALKRFIKAKRVVVIADACHSGGVGQQFDMARRSISDAKRNAISGGIQGLSNISNGIAVISAADDNQFSVESEKYGGGHGVFTWYLLNGLRGEADYNGDKQVTLGELIPYLSENVRRETRSAQSPTVAGKFDPAMHIGQY